MVKISHYCLAVLQVQKEFQRSSSTGESFGWSKETGGNPCNENEQSSKTGENGIRLQNIKL